MKIRSIVQVGKMLVNLLVIASFLSACSIPALSSNGSFAQVTLVPKLSEKSNIPATDNSGLEKAKKVIEKRLDYLGYKAKVDLDTANKCINAKIYLKSNETTDVVEGMMNAIVKINRFVMQQVDDKESKIGDVLLDGSHINKAALLQEKDELTLGIEFNADGTRILKESTSKLIGKQIGIFLDDELLLAPMVMVEIPDGKVSITKITREAGERIRMVAETGELPFVLEVVKIEIVN